MTDKTPANREQYHHLWQEALHLMKGICDDDEMVALESLTPQVVSPASWVLIAPNKFALDNIEKSSLPVLQKTLRKLGVTKIELKLAANPDLFASAPGKKNTAVTASFESNLNPDYRFENFVTAPSNNEAFAATERVSGKTFFADSNPLFIYGGTGLGKSHLMHAAGNALRRHGRNAVMYMTGEQFVNEFLAALAGKTQKAFSNRLRNVDALLVDDVQFLGGKDQSQAEFFHTFNELMDKKRQIILTCDRYPKEIEGLEARLKSRFGAGLTVSIRAPEPETRYAILKSKAKEQHFNLPDDVAFFIAENINSNVRDLEGALKKVIFQCQVIKGDSPASIAIAKAALHDQLQVQKNQTNVDNIQKQVAHYYNISLGEMLSDSRRQNIALPRMVAMALTRELTDMSLKSIAESFHRKDHSTVLNAIENIEKRRKNDPRFREEYETIKAIITG
ncbi:chromosomal replication initiator protein DnaA [Cardiobacterium valvarum]|uniref:Chromosomal replication initiator protein DnaA n=2 Tax=Cardiobacterium valvarum TaxID=194702 RepID=A0A381DW55_9GAMM|nr:chromosomal replication initiator protein DnaA [Cardiobacterium valvarum]EHM55688.1 replication initiator protein DnaA [Cardiobacterium valvarum F0432]SUX17171.1 Chromosomal replication initiator protein DnaA [Cardiobacterium valvarum]